MCVKAWVMSSSSVLLHAHIHVPMFVYYATAMTGLWFFTSRSAVKLKRVSGMTTQWLNDG